MNKKMTVQEIRSTFLHYFQQRGHEIVASSSLVPSNDATLLFTNAGMVQFKDVFLGNEVRPYRRATTAQRCLRAGGKHNDLENVGYTFRHHTFFEMLGNFSFGDYFKREAIQFAWEFLTETLKIPSEKLWVTVFQDDEESELIWLKERKIDPARFSKCGEKDNFWSMGDTGPCGPCTEIFYDHGAELPGVPPGFPGEEGDRFVEIWNLVFMQFNRDSQGRFTKLPYPCVDTGMGLERIAAVLQGVHDNYDIDLFQSLLHALSELIPAVDKTDKSMRVIVDHIRSVAFLIMDGVVPSNEGRGYVLRRIIRRAVRHGYKLGQRTPFFYQLTLPLVKIMGEAYPQLIHAQDVIERVILEEEEQFGSTLAKGIKIFDQKVERLTDRVMPGELVFQLYDTYGFPPDLTADIARERGLKIDYAGFDSAMTRQRQQSQQASRFSTDYTEQLYVSGASEFVGYETLSSEATVSAVLYDNRPVSLLKEGQQGAVALNRTPFYPESGGQIGDVGYLYTDEGSFHVLDTQKLGAVILHYGKLLKGTLKTGDQVRAEVSEKRQLLMLNHSATHLLHAALRKILGKQVVQKGSLVGPDRLRFDFSYPKALTIEQIRTIESLVNQQIRANSKIEKEEMSTEEAQAVGAMALFGEKYGKQVRVIRMGDFSVEICGGTHLESTGQIGLFKVIHESAVAAGIRRIEAVTGDAALAWITQEENQLRELCTLLKSARNEVVDKVHQVLGQNRLLNKEVAQLRQALADQQIQVLLNQITKIGGISVLAAKLLKVDQGMLRHTLDSLRNSLDSYAIVLAAVKGGKVLLVSGVSKDVLSYFNATELLKVVADRVGGRGGGRADLAQGGGEDPSELSPALGRVVEWVKEKLVS